MTHRIIYMGTPEFACPALRALSERIDLDVALVVTQPDRPAGRGRQLQSPPVKQLAELLGLPVYQPQSLRTAEQRQPLLDIRPDLIVVAAYGLILGRSILELPMRGCVNLHASILPRYRGASPISAAILCGDQETGVTLMRMERGLDTGPVFDVVRIEIGGNDTTASLTDRLAVTASELLVLNIDGLLNGSLGAVTQPSGATLTRPLVKDDGWIDWTRPMVEVERLVRAMWPWPRAWTTLADGSAFQIHIASIDPGQDNVTPGTLWNDRSGLRVRCGDGWLQIERGQLAGGKPLTRAQLASKPQLASGAVLGGDIRPTVPGPMMSFKTG
ncbi:MAG: methionyl-tRNA formyltransferase [Chloroflexota bacterium]|nr:methionyl-tRNA formyltransferase [Chloroflexota bacterium]